MAKATQAIKLRLEIAIPVDLASMDSVQEATAIVEALKAKAKELGGAVTMATTSTGRHAFSTDDE